jgi:hypothetical protein
MTALLHIDPSRALHAAWHATAPEPFLAIGGGGCAALAAGINWLAIASFVGVAVPLAWGIIVQCRKQWVIANLEIDAARRRLAEPAAAEPTTA